MADTVATVEYQSLQVCTDFVFQQFIAIINILTTYFFLQLAATLSAAADSLRNCANVAEAFANILRQTTATGAPSSSVQGNFPSFIPRQTR